MKKVRLGLCIGDNEYSLRFTNCIMNHYQEQVELHIYSENAELKRDRKSYDIVLIDDVKNAEKWGGEVPVLCLYDSKEGTEKQEEGGVYWVEQYQEVNRIVDEILKQVGEEIQCVCQGERLPGKAQILGVYSLAENEYQLPFAVTLVTLMGEHEKVLLLDLQENSGISQLTGTDCRMGLEELLVMAEKGRYATNRLISCIAHLENIDVAYPVYNTECLCEAQMKTYQKLFHTLAKEMGYETIVLNFGTRFVGFFETLDICQQVYLMKSRGGIGQWREKEFFEELDQRNLEQVRQKIQSVEIPLMTTPIISCERLVEQWKWNEFGDRIRNLMPGVRSVG